MDGSDDENLTVSNDACNEWFYSFTQKSFADSAGKKRSKYAFWILTQTGFFTLKIDDIYGRYETWTCLR